MPIDPTSMSRDYLILRVLAGLMAAVVVVPAAFAGHLNLFVAVLLAAAVVLAVVDRDRLHGLFSLGLVVLAWLVAGPPASTPWAIFVAVAMIVEHSALAMRTTQPPSAPLDRAAVRRWAARTGLVALVAPVVWLASAGLSELDTRTGEVVAAAALVLLGVLVLLLRAEVVREIRQ